MPSYLITGSSRGLGLGFVTDLLKDPDNLVIATACNPGQSIAEAARKAKKLLPEGLDHLISNAGISLQPLVSFDDIDTDELLAEITFNTVKTINVLRTFLPIIRERKEKSITVISSQLGSIEIGAMMPALANPYSVSKAALNMLARKWSALLKPEGITMSILHPGWVATELADPIVPWMEEYNPNTKQLTTEELAAACVQMFRKVTIDETGSFFNHDGTKILF